MNIIYRCQKRTILLALMLANGVSAYDMVDINDLRSNLVTDQSPVTLKVIRSSGSGCPSGTASSVIAPDGKSFILGFDAYLAEAGPNIPLREGRKFCNLTLLLNVPNGITYTVASVNYRGYAFLEPWVEATQKSTYFFAGNVRQGSMQTKFRGPYDSDYSVGDSLGFNSQVWAACNAQQPMSIKTEVRVNNRLAPEYSGIITTDTIDGKLTHQYGLQFRYCD
jgi:hypothetical protein